MWGHHVPPQHLLNLRGGTFFLSSKRCSLTWCFDEAVGGHFQTRQSKTSICVQLSWDLLTATSFPYASNNLVNTMPYMHVEVTPLRLDLFHMGWMDSTVLYWLCIFWFGPTCVFMGRQVDQTILTTRANVFLCFYTNLLRFPLNFSALSVWYSILNHINIVCIYAPNNVTNK